MRRLYRAPIIHFTYIVSRHTLLSSLASQKPGFFAPAVSSAGVTGDFSSVSLRSRRRPSLAPALPFRILSPHRTGGLPVIPRYTRPEMARIWSDENRFRTWLAVEVAATETLAAAGLVPKDAAKAIKERADFRVERIHEIEAEVRHDVIAFTTAVAEIVGPHARWFHYGLTSNDVVDTAQALLIRQASQVIAQDLERLAEVLERRAWEFKDTPMVGRTHGIHAEPITFGFKIANWYSETQR